MTARVSMSWPEYKRRQVRVGGGVVQLTAHQTEIVSTLLMRRGDPVSVSELIEVLYADPWAEPKWSDWCVRTQISFTRGRMPGVIQTNGWRGYSIPRDLLDHELPGIDAPERAIAVDRRLIGNADLKGHCRAQIRAAVPNVCGAPKRPAIPVHASGGNL